MRGNVHIGIGDSIFYGENVRSHIQLDIVYYQTTVTMDGHKVVVQNRVLFSDQARRKCMS